MTNSVDPDQLASLKPTDLELHCLASQGISWFSRPRVNNNKAVTTEMNKLALTSPSSMIEYVSQAPSLVP